MLTHFLNTTADGDLSNAGNWDSGIPSGADDAQISAAATSGSVTAATITLDSGISLAGCTLTCAAPVATNANAISACSLNCDVTVDAFSAISSNDFFGDVTLLTGAGTDASNNFHADLTATSPSSFTPTLVDGSLTLTNGQASSLSVIGATTAFASRFIGCQLYGAVVFNGTVTAGNFFYGTSVTYAAGSVDCPDPDDLSASAFGTALPGNTINLSGVTMSSLFQAAIVHVSGPVVIAPAMNRSALLAGTAVTIAAGGTLWWLPSPTNPGAYNTAGCTVSVAGNGLFWNFTGSPPPGRRGVAPRRPQ